MIPLVMAAALFGRHWGGKLVEFVVDNAAVVAILKATYSKDLHLMHLVCVLVFLASKFGFWFRASHIPGVKNVAADALSRNVLSSFFSQVPQADPLPLVIPPPLVTLISHDITWTCRSWIRQFKDTLEQV